MEKIIHLPYGKGSLRFALADKNIKAILVPSETPEKRISQEKIVIDALKNPINSATLADLSLRKKRITIITSDHTRAVPSHITMPLLLDSIRSSNPSAEIKILIGTGLHRAMTLEEMNARFGPDIVSKERIIVHDATEKEEMVSIGILPSGSSCSINRHALETDLLISEGFIEPHFFAGFSGGRKSVLPGIASKETINANHSARAIAHERSRTGILEGNPIHEDMLYAANKAGLRFILNVVEDVEKRIIGAVAGDLNDAHLKGCEMVSMISGVERVKADVVVASNGGYPLDQNLYQTTKGISTAAECLLPGGVIVIAAECIDGIGGDNFEELLFKGKPKEILELLLTLRDEETISEQWCNQVLSKILVDHPVILVSKLEPDIVRKANLIPAEGMQQAMEIAFAIKNRDASVTVIPDGVSVIVRQ